MAIVLAAATGRLHAQQPIPPDGSQPQSMSTYQGSVAQGSVSDTPIDLSLDQAIERGLKNNLGILLSGTQAGAAGGQRLQQLQSLLPSLDGSIKETVMESDLQAEGLRIPGFPVIIGPFGFTDLRASLSWSLLNLPSLHNYLASRRNFEAAKLSAQDAREMVILTVGNAYLLVLADQSRVETAEAQVKTSKVSLDQAAANHQAGTAPELDELRARVDYQTQEQQAIVAANQLEKDKLALARAIGLPLAQKFELTDKVPYSAFDRPDIEQAIRQARENRKDLQAYAEQVKSYEQLKSAATSDRLPSLKFDGDYGDIGTNVNHSHGTGSATGTLTIPIFKEAEFRGESQVAKAQLEQRRDQLSDAGAQVDADVRDALLDIASTEKLVEASHSNVELAAEALNDAQQRYAAGVSDNLPVSQAQQAVAQANSQYVSSLYQHNVAKLNLARALGMAQSYKSYLGGK